MNRLLRSRAATAGLIVVVLVLSSACGPKGKKPTLTPGTDADKYLFDQGNAALKKRNWLKSREYFRQIVENYPQSRYRPDAKLGLADTYLGEKTVESLILGANEYREFLTFFPTNERAAYAQYQLARTHHQQMLAPQRDQTQTREAIAEYELLIERFPDSPLIADGRKGLQDCRDRLSGADYAVGHFYYKSRWYPGAVSRFRAVLKENPQFGGRDALYYFLADSYVRMGAAPDALPLLDKLAKEFQKSEYLVRGEKLTASIKNGTAAEAIAREADKQNKKAQKADTSKKKAPRP